MKFITILLFFITVYSCSNSKETLPKKEEIVKESNTEKKQIPDGDFIQKHPNGAILVKGKILNNKREGLWTTYYQSGIKQSESTYKSDVLNGRTASFYTNGQVRYIGYFLNNKKDGKWDFYTEDGDFEKSQLYVKGKLSKEEK